VKERRREAGFEPAGSIGPDQLGLPRKQARALLVALAWRRVAGERLAGRFAARRVSRGVLEVESLEAGSAEELRAVLPELAGRIAAAHPDLDIRKGRVVESGRRKAALPTVDIVPYAGPGDLENGGP